MDPISFTVGIAGLANIFTSCIECFEIIQLGRHVGKDSEECMLRLKGVQLKMTRWSASIGIGGQATSLTPEQISTTAEEEFEYAEELIAHIMTALSSAEKISSKFKAQCSMPEDQAFGDPATTLSAKSKPLHDKMDKLISSRLRGLHLGTRVKWAVYEKKKFDTMIESVAGFVDKLVELFPAAQNNRVALCKAEVVEIKDEEELRLVKDVVGKDDALLLKTVNEALRYGYKTFVEGYTSEGRAKVHIGDNLAKGEKSESLYVLNSSAGEDATVHIGHNIGYDKPL
jgi:hypothetical protein